MSISMINSNINRTNKDIADLQKKIADEKKTEAQLHTKIVQVEKSINKNTSASMYKSKMDQISRHSNDIARSSSKQADWSKKLASKQADLNKYTEQLSREQAEENKKQMDAQKKIQKEQLEYQKNITKELEAQKKAIQESNTLTRIAPVIESREEEQVKYDVFISHASEDKEDFVRPLADELVKLGVNVWYDEFSMKWGDSLRRSIDMGLANSKYGVIVLSTSFINKRWPAYEVDGLVAREIEGEKVILPIWHKVTKSEVMRYSPTLADKIAMNSSIDEISDIAAQLKSML
ncbi:MULTISPECIES: TIR domain-containing protein [Paenibacillus]|uniref:TIR domain-containing protein n=1 Tax=Paenibacillus TaxID=44249 RepID=UPI0009700D69|nr:TIR domain-containing protein [Paenibacillus odorifer]OME05991.1 molecular chaperone Tir [Paenibacillus odorifer]